MLDGKTPNQVVAERLKARRQLAHTKTHGRAGPNDIVKARLLVEAAKEVSQPDKYACSDYVEHLLTRGFRISMAVRRLLGRMPKRKASSNL